VTILANYEQAIDQTITLPDGVDSLVTESIAFTTTLANQMVLPMVYGGAQLNGNGNGRFQWWLDGSPFYSQVGGWFDTHFENVLGGINGPALEIATAGSHTLQLAAHSVGGTATWYCRPIALPGIEGLGLTIYGL
jgi:hypothetical protein